MAEPETEFPEGAVDWTVGEAEGEAANAVVTGTAPSAGVSPRPSTESHFLIHHLPLYTPLSNPWKDRIRK